MRDPRWIGTTFGTFLHLIKAAKFSGTAPAPSATIILLSAVVLWQPKPDAPSSLNTLSEVRLPLAAATASAVTAASVAAPAIASAAVPALAVAKAEARPAEPTPVATVAEKRNVPAAATAVRGPVFYATPAAPWPPPATRDRSWYREKSAYARVIGHR